MSLIKAVPIIPSTEMTSAYDNEPKKYGQAALSNIIDSRSTFYSSCSIGSYIYRSVNDDYSTKVIYANHIKGFSELNAGAHYYVMSAYSTAYSKASARVNLAEVKCNRAGNRNGFISLSLVTEGTQMRQCDIGLGYMTGSSGEGWYPVSWSRDQTNTLEICEIEAHSIKNFKANGKFGKKLPGNALVEIQIEVKKTSNYDYVYGSIYTISTAGEKTLFAEITYCGNKGKFFSTHYSKPHVRFTRFMSLVPTDEGCPKGYCADYADGSSLCGVMRNCRLNTTPWDKSLIAFAWSMQGVNITNLQISQLTDASIAADADKCIINHLTNTHGIPVRVNPVT